MADPDSIRAKAADKRGLLESMPLRPCLRRVKSNTISLGVGGKIVAPAREKTGRIASMRPEEKEAGKVEGEYQGEPRGESPKKLES